MKLTPARDGSLLPALVFGSASVPATDPLTRLLPPSEHKRRRVSWRTRHLKKDIMKVVQLTGARDTSSQTSGRTHRYKTSKSAATNKDLFSWSPEAGQVRRRTVLLPDVQKHHLIFVDVSLSGMPIPPFPVKNTSQTLWVDGRTQIKFFYLICWYLCWWVPRHEMKHHLCSEPVAYQKLVIVVAWTFTFDVCNNRCNVQFVMWSHIFIKLYGFQHNPKYTFLVQPHVSNPK